MEPYIFLSDFEITESTAELHEMFGRALIIATRFDNLCNHTAKFLNIKTTPLIRVDEELFVKYVEDLFLKLTTLNNNIQSLPLTDIGKDILHKARKARNDVAHSLTRGMTGCLDINFEYARIKDEIQELTSKIAKGDYLISRLLSILNKDPLPNYSEQVYIDNIVNWVLKKMHNEAKQPQSV
ncbi:MAG: hypothetical protein ACI88H_004217 [Cocleimonas sp.]|jgi:hypothetical protein